jgi:hypothetical protein
MLWQQCCPRARPKTHAAKRGSALAQSAESRPIAKTPPEACIAGDALLGSHSPTAGANAGNAGKSPACRADSSPEKLERLCMRGIMRACGQSDYFDEWKRGAGQCRCGVASDFSLIASKARRSDDSLKSQAAFFFGEAKTCFDIALLGRIVADQESDLSPGATASLAACKGMLK